MHSVPSFDYFDSPRLPVIDLSLAAEGQHSWLNHLGAQLDWAAAEFGFFYVVGHGVSASVVRDMAETSRRFFALPQSEKDALHMQRGGRAWRGYFPVGGELTSGRPDLKEGIYLGAELGLDDARVRGGLPLHGPNLYPAIPGFREATQRYLLELTRLGHRLMALLGRGLGIGESYFAEHYTDDPTVLFRVFNYPEIHGTRADARGVGEHTDYGLLTMLWQDEIGGLEVRYEDQWVDVPYLPDSFVVNIGDMLERLTSGRYRSALHRVINRSDRNRLSMPFFFDPRFDAGLDSIPGIGPVNLRPELAARWDGLDLHALGGTYGEYLVGKVARVFPELGRGALGI